MRRRAALLWMTATLACHRTPAPRHAAPHTEDGHLDDDGAGVLASQSMQLVLDGHPEDEPAAKPATAPVVPRRYRVDHGDPAGGVTYGGKPYANWRAPSIDGTTPRVPRYTVTTVLPGAIEGTVTWGGAAPGPLATACGAIDNPSLRVGRDRALGDTLVYIERVTVGRAPTPAAMGHPAAIGGTVAKRGCALEPTAQIAAPQPVQLALASDSATTLLVSAGMAAPPTALTRSRIVEVERGGRALAMLNLGVTRVEATSGGVVPAWVVVIESPYYTLTDDAGRYRLDDLAAGRYEVVFWHAPIVTSVGGKLVWGDPLVTRQIITVGASTPARANVVMR